MRKSLSLPEVMVKSVRRRNEAFAETWRQRVDWHADAQAHAVVRANRLKHAASVADLRTDSRQSVVHSARRLLGTPLPAGMTPRDFETVSASRREALNAMHADCLRREERARQHDLARRAAVLAADQAETLGHLKAEAAFRVQSNRAMLEKELAHRRTLERKQVLDVHAAAKFERAKEKVAKAKQKARKEAALAEAVAARRAVREEMQKQWDLKTGERQAAREKAAKAKAEAKRALQEHLEREKAADYAKRLEKASKRADALAVRAADEFSSHVFKFQLETERDELLASATEEADLFAGFLQDGEERDGEDATGSEGNAGGSFMALMTTSGLSTGGSVLDEKCLTPVPVPMPMPMYTPHAACLLHMIMPHTTCSVTGLL